MELSRGQQRLDEAAGAFGVRKIGVGKDEKGVPRVLLNGKFEFQAGVLDAGRWPDGGATAPSERGLRKDLEAIKQLGFNMVRKKGKVEPDYWYYQCDRLGVLVWQDAPARAGGEGADEAERKKELRRLVEERGQHPSIVAWVVGGKGAAHDAKILKAIDPGRLVVAAGGAPGGEEVGDVDDISGQFPEGRPGRASVGPRSSATSAPSP